MYFDIVIAIPLLWAIYHGFKKGLIIELSSILGLLFGIYGAIGLSEFTEEFLKAKLEMNSQGLSILAFAITFILIIILVYFIAKLLEGVISVAALSVVNKIFGSVFGMLKMALMISALVFLINSIDKKQKLFNEGMQQKSYTYKIVQPVAPKIFPSINKLWQDSTIENAVETGAEKLRDK